jgi:hypothetical protein
MRGGLGVALIHAVGSPGTLCRLRRGSTVPEAVGGSGNSERALRDESCKALSGGYAATAGTASG